MTLLTRRKKPRRTREGSLPAHLAWIRGFHCLCAVHGGCSDRIEAAHVRKGTDGGASLKPHDKWAVPLCSAHHAEQHSVGEDTFSQRYGLDMKSAAAQLWQLSPHGKKYRKENG